MKIKCSQVEILWKNTNIVVSTHASDEKKTLRLFGFIMDNAIDHKMQKKVI